MQKQKIIFVPTKVFPLGERVRDEVCLFFYPISYFQTKNCWNCRKMSSYNFLFMQIKHFICISQLNFLYNFFSLFIFCINMLIILVYKSPKIKIIKWTVKFLWMQIATCIDMPSNLNLDLILPLVMHANKKEKKKKLSLYPFKNLLQMYL